GNTETVNFQIPRTQINQLTVKPEVELVEDEVDGMQTHHDYTSNGSALKLAKEDLEKMIG
ncbi:MAG: hypothetical protein RIE59_25810, partial [Imperialibacter sp.]